MKRNEILRVESEVLFSSSRWCLKKKEGRDGTVVGNSMGTHAVVTWGCDLRSHMCMGTYADSRDPRTILLGARDFVWSGE